MAIAKNNFRVLQEDFPASGDKDERRSMSSLSEFQDEGNDDETDSAADSDDFDFSDLGGVGTELCKVGNSSCSIPYELYDLDNLNSILNVDTWNNCLSEEERFSLAEFLPDMDQEAFMRTMKELFSDCNFHFGNPVTNLFNMLKGGLCEPKVAIYRQGLIFFQKHQHYHLLREYHNTMVDKIVHIKRFWENCTGYGIKEKLRLLRMKKLGFKMGKEDRGIGLCRNGFKKSKFSKKIERGTDYNPKKMEDVIVSNGQALRLKASKGILKVSTLKNPTNNSEVEPDHPSINRRWKYKDEKLFGKTGHSRKGKKKYSEGHLIDSPNMSDEDMHGSYDNSYFNVRDKNISQIVGRGRINSSDYGESYPRKKVKYNEEEDWIYIPKDQINRPDGSKSPWKINELPHTKNKKWKSEKSSQVVRKFTMPLISKDPSKRFLSEAKSSHFYPMHNGGIEMEDIRTSNVFVPNEDTESDSSEHGDVERDIKPFAKRTSFSSGSLHDPNKMGQLDGKDKTEHVSILDGCKTTTVKRGGKIREQVSKHKSKTRDPNYSHGYAMDEVENIFSLTLRNRDDKKQARLLKNSQIPKNSPKQNTYSKENYCTEKVDLDYMPELSYMDNDVGGAERSDSYGIPETIDRYQWGRKSGNKCQNMNENSSKAELPQMLQVPFVGSNTKAKKQKVKDDTLERLDYLKSSQSAVDDPLVLKTRGKRKIDSETSSLNFITSHPELPDGLEEIEPEEKLLKKPFMLITPSIHTGFSFSIVHLLSAVRMAMITLHAEDDLEERGMKIETRPDFLLSNSPMDEKESSDQFKQNIFQSLTVQEIVDGVKTNPGDPCILETQEPLFDLVRGVLKLLTSKTAPLGAKAWKPLVSYESKSKRWTWVGPPPVLSGNDAIPEETSPESWGIPHKMLVKLVDAFANWLKSGQETLRQIGSLPAPPTVLMVNIDEKERFRDLRAQKSLNTISPSSEEVRDYFRKEEALRYSIPDRAFCYTAADGKKSIVAPLRRGGGKPTSKARDHFLLKPDRPPHVTILCLVRDAAARLPGSIGTRADVCTLLRDSQYIVEDVPETSVTQVVSGALDRLHYERDPCVQFDGDRKLWVYLHRDREEQDFEDDGTASTKKWKRPKKDAAGHSDSGAVNNVDETGFDSHVAGNAAVRYEFSADLNMEESPPLEEKAVLGNLKPKLEEFSEPLIGSGVGNIGRVHAIHWEDHGLNLPQEGNMLCLENSTNEEFDDETFHRESSSL